MRKITAGLFIALDGVVEEPAEWHFPYFNEEMGAAVGASLEGADTVLFGRKTYDSFAGAWPERDGPFADKFNTMPKYVVSSTLESPDWNNTTVVGSDAVEAARKVKEQVDGVIQVPGSLRLVQDLFENDLVDELHLMVFPVVLGTGRKLFTEQSEKSAWKLKELRPVGPDGVLVATYERADRS